ncbi:MAG: response regulator [Acidobacteriaceae bacterium]
MPSQNASLLVIDDHAAIRQLLSTLLTESGYRVRSAEDGFSALAEIRNEIPDIIVSDLYMPGMSGFELLSVIRRRFPAIQVIATSGAFSGDDVPPGVAADAFYEKGSSPAHLLRMVETMAQTAPLSPRRSATIAPIWIAKNGHDPSGEEYVMVTCPECLRAFPQVLGSENRVIHETGCVNCSTPIHYAIVQKENQVSSLSKLTSEHRARQFPPPRPATLVDLGRQKPA